jgi:Mg2+-importing ATPase
VATRPATDEHPPAVEDEHGLRLAGLLVFLDPPKQDAAAALHGWPAWASRSRW